MGSVGPARALGLVHRFETGARSVGKDDVERADVIDRHAVGERAAARRVVADHAADGRAVAGGRVGPEHQPVRCGGLIELVLHDPDLDHGGPGVRVDLEDPIHVAREVEHQAGPDRLACEAGTGTAGNHRDTELGGRPHYRHHIVLVAREHDPGRHDRVHARVPREQVPGVVVEGDLADTRDRRAPSRSVSHSARRALSVSSAVMMVNLSRRYGRTGGASATDASRVSRPAGAQVQRRGRADRRGPPPG